jgi:hypothetical protein
MTTYQRELTVKRKTHSDPSRLLIFEGQAKVGELNKVGEIFELIESKGANLRITQKVDGVVHPFSALVVEDSKVVLKMRDAYFAFGGKLYSFCNPPQGETLASRHGQRRFITRLDGYDGLEPWTQNKAEQRNIKRSRGTKVGEICGYSVSGHTVTITDEKLDSIAIPLATISCLFFSGV